MNERTLIQQQAPTSVMNAIYERRSVRSFKPQKVGPATIRTLLAAAVRAPTAIHEEPWAFVVIQDRGTLRRLSDRGKQLLAEQAHGPHLDRGGHALEAFAKPDFNLFYDAGTLIVICGKPMGPFVVADCWLAAENLILAASAMDLGTCVIGSAVPALNEPKTKAELGIPPEISAIAPVILGIPAGAGLPTPRKAPQILSWK